MNPKPKVQITGLGAVCCAGQDPLSLWQNAIESRSAIKNGLGKISPSSEHQESPLYYALVAARQAMATAGWNTFEKTDGFILATTTGYVSTWDKKLMQFFSHAVSEPELMGSFRNERLGILFDDICENIHFHGKRELITTACSASTHALGLATLWLRTGQVKRVLVGGIEIISPLTIEGFRSFQLLSSETCTPFSAGRRGINLSDGSAFLCLETNATKPLAEIVGVGFSTDAYHMTAPHPQGAGSFQAMKSAIQMAGIRPEEISWVHAHGTGSEHNDLSEGIALERLFEGNTPKVTSTKAIHGHSLAASGALESVLCVQALQNQMILPTLGLTDPDPRIKISICRQVEHANIKYILKNTLGFGGANGALVFKKADT